MVDIKKELLIKEINSLKDELNANVTRTVFMTYSTGVGALGFMLQYSDFSINQYFNYYSNFLNSHKLAQIVPITLFSIGVPLTLHSIKGIVDNSQKIKTKKKELNNLEAN